MKKTTEFGLKATKKHKANKAWINRHCNDHYVHLAKANGYRARSAYKLLEIDDAYKLLANATCIVDLGSSPGSWSQVATERMAKNGFILSVDLLPMQDLPQVNFIQGDFTDNKILEQMLVLLNGRKIDLIMSDMAPNLSGIKTVDQARSAYLIELVLDFAKNYLTVNGNCIIKVFIGGEFTRLMNMARDLFERVAIYKPNSSRTNSSETYLFCQSRIF
jgi:23S rRNA (uridine2552-2'-O)-methyltransferase